MRADIVSDRGRNFVSFIRKFGQWTGCLVAATVGLSAVAIAADDPSPDPRPIAAVFELQVDPPVWRKLFDLPNGHRCNSPRVTADGRRLAFDGWNLAAAETNSEASVFIANLDGSDLKMVCSGAMPSPSPDGRHFACSRYGGDGGVWIMAFDQSKAELIDRAGWGIQWSPDGASVAYIRANNIVIRTLATGDERLLFPETGSPFTRIYWNMSWSADSRQIALMGAPAAGQYELATVDAQGAEFGFQRLTAGTLVPSITWNAEKRPIVFPDKVQKAYRMLELDPAPNAQPRVIPGIPADSKATSASWTPDGSRLIVICNFN